MNVITEFEHHGKPGWPKFAAKMGSSMCPQSTSAGGSKSPEIPLKKWMEGSELRYEYRVI
jgi:hypothetical protein